MLDSGAEAAARGAARCASHVIIRGAQRRRALGR
jgi:hypothetical protein